MKRIKIAGLILILWCLSIPLSVYASDNLPGEDVYGTRSVNGNVNGDYEGTITTDLSDVCPSFKTDGGDKVFTCTNESGYDKTYAYAVIAQDEEITVSFSRANIADICADDDIQISFNDTGYIVSVPQMQDFDCIVSYEVTYLTGYIEKYFIFINPVLGITSVDFVNDKITIWGTNWYMDSFPTSYTIGDTYYGCSLSGSIRSIKTNNMETLIVDNENITANGALWYSSNMSNLKVFDIYGIGDENAGMYSGSFTIESLEELHLSDEWIHHIACIVGCTNLNYLNMEDNTYLPSVTESFKNENDSIDIVIPDNILGIDTGTSMYFLLSGGSNTDGTYNKAVRSITFGTGYTQEITKGAVSGRDIEVVDLSKANMTSLGPLEGPPSSIYNAVFQDSKIGELKLPSSLTTLKPQTFKNVEIGTLDMSECNITEITQTGIFANCKIGTLILPDSLKTVSVPFLSMVDVDTIILPNGLQDSQSLYLTLNSIGNLRVIGHSDGAKGNGIELNGMPFNPSNLEEVDLPLNVTKLTSTFNGTSNLKKVTGLGHVESITGSFQGCSSLESIDDLSDMSSITGSFSGCTKLKIPSMSNIELISASFQGCSGVQTGNISLTGIGNIKGSSLTNISCSGNLTIEAESISEGSIGSVSVGGKLSLKAETAKDGCFSTCTAGSLSVMVDNLSSSFANHAVIGGNADISDCSNIGQGSFSKLSVAGNLTVENCGDIGEGAFNTSNVQGDLIIDNVQKTYDGAFAGSSIGGDVLVSNVNRLGDSTATGNKGSSLSSVVVTGKIEVSDVENMYMSFCGIQAGSEIKLNGIDEIKNAFVSPRGNYDITISDIGTMEQGCFSGMTAKDISIQNVNKITNGGFSGTADNVYICGVDMLDDGTFVSTRATSIEVDNSTIGANGLLDISTDSMIIKSSSILNSGCCNPKYREVILENVDIIGMDAFSSTGNSVLKSIIIKDSDVEIGADAFNINTPTSAVKTPTTLVIENSPKVQDAFFNQNSNGFCWLELYRTYETLITDNPHDNSIPEKQNAQFSASVSIPGGIWQWYKAEQTDDVLLGLQDLTSGDVSEADGHITLSSPGTAQATKEYSLGMYNGGASLYSLGNPNVLCGTVTITTPDNYDAQSDYTLDVNGIPVSSGTNTYDISEFNSVILSITSLTDQSVPCDIQLSCSAYKLEEIDGATQGNYTIQDATKDISDTLYCCSYGTAKASDIDTLYPFYIEFSKPAVLTVTAAKNDVSSVNSDQEDNTSDHGENSTTSPKQNSSASSVVAANAIVQPVLQQNDVYSQNQIVSLGGQDTDLLSSNRKPAETSDRSNTLLWVLTLVTASALLAVYILVRKKKRNR